MGGMGMGGMGMGGMGMGMGESMGGMDGRNLRGRGAPIDFDEFKAPPLPEAYSYNPSLFNVDWENFDRLE
eukprot:scaffold33777_cov183-Skeletonema_dohrnii-CCMP3373.AAC.1